MEFVAFTRSQFEQLDDTLAGILSRIEDLGPIVAQWFVDNPDAVGDAVDEYLSEHGAEVGYTITDGDLEIVIG